MAKHFFRYDRHTLEGGCLRPSDRASAEALSKRADGDILSAEIRKPRNPKHHRKLFALLQIVHESTGVQDRYPTVENLLDALKHETGHVEPVFRMNGEMVLKPKSIAFESMSQERFEEFYDRVIRIIATHLVPGIDEEALRSQAEEMCG